MRTVIDIPDHQIEALRRFGERAYTSRAEVIQSAIADYIPGHGPDDGDDTVCLWRERVRDALEMEDDLRSEWS
jgi:metal-responsive CopG/Arc/MetJ family transcriptional regulator